MTSLTTGSGGQYTNNGENALSQLRYLWRGGRYDGDGVVLMGNGAEQDTHRGTPLGDDAFADATYQPGQFFSAENGEWTTAQERYGDAGTQGQWSTPSTSMWSYLPGAIADSASARASAVWGAAKQIGYTLADIGNDAVYNYTFWNGYVANGFDAAGVDGLRFYKGSLSGLGQSIDSGAVDPLSSGYAGMAAEGVGNAVTFGGYDMAKASAQLGMGSIGWDEWGDRMAVGGASMLVAAATMPGGANVRFGGVRSAIQQARFGADSVGMSAGLASARQMAWSDTFGQPGRGLSSLVSNLGKGHFVRQQMAAMIREIRESGGAVGRGDLGPNVFASVGDAGGGTGWFRYNPMKLRGIDALEEAIHWQQIKNGMLGRGYSRSALETMAKRSLLNGSGGRLGPGLRAELLSDIRRIRSGTYFAMSE